MHKGQIVLLYFSATSNTKLIVDTYAKTFNDQGYITEIIKVEEIDKIKNINFNKVDLLGVAYPCYAFDYPKKIMDPALNLIQRQVNNKPAFIINTFCINSGLSVKNIADKLQDKHFDTIYVEGFKCPSPGFVSITSSLESTHKIKYSILNRLMVFEHNILMKAEYFAKETIKAFDKYKENMFKLKIKVKRISYIGRKLAKWNEKRIFNDYKINMDKCLRCALCVRQCPINNIIMINGKPEFADNNNCLRCMKCISNCPKDAITLGWRTQGMDRYNEDTRLRLISNKSE